MRMILFISCLAFPALVHTQNCYEDYLQRGIEAYNDFSFENALNLFNAAKICPAITEEQTEEVAEWHEKASVGYIEAIKKARDEALEAQEAAQIAQREAENQARLTEANRRAYLATQELENGNWDDALLLAFTAKDMAGADAHAVPHVERAFGQVVAQSLSLPLESDNSHHLEFGQLSDGTIWGRSDDGYIRFWNREGTLINKIGESGESAKMISIAPDESMFLLMFKLSLIKLLNRDGNLTGRLTGLEGPASSMKFSPDGKQIVSGSRDGMIKIWDQNGGSVLDLSLSDAPVHHAIFLPDGNSILIRSGDQTVRLIDPNGKLLAELKHEKYIYSTEIAPDQPLVLTASADRTAGIWDLNGNSIAKLTHPDIVYKAEFSPAGEDIWTVCLDGKVRKWSIAGEKLLELIHPASISDIQFSTDGKQVLAFSGSQSIVWDENGNRKCIVNHDNEIIGAQFSPDGILFLTNSEDRIRVWDLTGKMIMEIERFDKVELSGIGVTGKINAEIIAGGVQQAGFSNDGSFIITLSSDGGIYLTQNPIRVFEVLQANPPEVTEEQKEKFSL